MAGESLPKYCQLLYTLGRVEKRGNSRRFSFEIGKSSRTFGSLPTNDRQESDNWAPRLGRYACLFSGNSRIENVTRPNGK